MRYWFGFAFLADVDRWRHGLPDTWLRDLRALRRARRPIWWSSRR
jgi:hypothetical protein